MSKTALNHWFSNSNTHTPMNVQYGLFARETNNGSSTEDGLEGGRTEEDPYPLMIILNKKRLKAELV